MSNDLTIGVDIGGTKTAFVVADSNGEIHDSKTLPTQPRDDFMDSARRIISMLNTFMETFENIRGIGIGVPGPVDVSRGIALQAANLGWNNAPIHQSICAGLSRPLPVYVENDVNAGAIGERLFGAAKGIDDFVYLTVGTGIGGAVVIDSHLLRGASHSEMEIGHVSMDPVSGRQCTCGQRGCLEMSASGKGLVTHARQHLLDYPQTSLTADSLTTRDIIVAAEKQDPLAIHVIQEAANALGIACAWCINLFNPARIILGGGLIHASYHLLEEQTLQAARARSLPLNFQSVTVSLSSLRDGALGASALVWHRQIEGNIV